MVFALTLLLDLFRGNARGAAPNCLIRSFITAELRRGMLSAGTLYYQKKQFAAVKTAKTTHINMTKVWLAKR